MIIYKGFVLFILKRNEKKYIFKNVVVVVVKKNKEIIM